ACGQRARAAPWKAVETCRAHHELAQAAGVRSPLASADCPGGGAGRGARRDRDCCRCGPACRAPRRLDPVAHRPAYGYHVPSAGTRTPRERLTVRSGRPVLLLCSLIAAAATQLGHPLVDVFVLPFLGTLLAAHVDRESGTLAEVVVRAAAQLLPASERADLRDEWIDHVRSAGEYGVLPLTRALS